MMRSNYSMRPHRRAEAVYLDPGGRAPCIGDDSTPGQLLLRIVYPIIACFDAGCLFHARLMRYEVRQRTTPHRMILAVQILSSSTCVTPEQMCLHMGPTSPMYYGKAGSRYLSIARWKLSKHTVRSDYCALEVQRINYSTEMTHRISITKVPRCL